MLLNDSPKSPDPLILKFGLWLGDRLPDKAIYDFPFDQAVNAFMSGKTVLLRIRSITPTKHDVQLWVEK